MSTGAFIGAAAGAGLGAIGGAFGAHQENKNRRNARRRGQGVLWGSKEGFSAAFQDGTMDPSELGGAFGRISHLFGQQENELRTGYREAREEVGRLGSESRRGIFERGQQGVADAKQSSISRGLYGGRAAAISQRQANRDTERRSAELDERLAGIRAGLRERQAQALGQHYGMRWAAESPLFQLQFDLMTGLSSGTNSTFASLQGAIDGAGAGFNIGSTFDSDGKDDDDDKEA